MFTELFKIVYKNAQTLGKEDVLTALLASMFEISPELCIYFFKHPYLSCPDLIMNDVTEKHRIKTGITYYNEFDDPSANYKFRPDLLITTSDTFSDFNSHKILVESKIFASLTSNQYKGYPEIKKRNSSSIFIILITNYENSEFINYFDRVISWKQTDEIIREYLNYQSNLKEHLIISEILESFEAIGVELNEFIYTNLKSNKTVESFIDIPTFVKAMRKNLGMTQESFAKEVGVGLRFIRELEQGKKETLRSDKVNIVLKRFNCTLAPVTIK
jgi:DNA-binding transcriptional regulator YiaG